jgi:hypothetical protein
MVRPTHDKYLSCVVSHTFFNIDIRGKIYKYIHIYINLRFINRRFILKYAFEKIENSWHLPESFYRSIGNLDL